MFSRRLWSCVLLIIVAALFWVYRQHGSGLSAKGSRSVRVLAPAADESNSPSRASLRRVRPPAAATTATPQREETPAPIAVFEEWHTAWRRADPGGQQQLIATGRELAVARRAALKQLIQTDPRRALELAMPAGLGAELPPVVREQLERQIDGRGDLEVIVSCSANESRVERSVVIEGQRLSAFVYGRRAEQPTKFGLPLHGVAVDDVFALAEAPWRVLDDGEKSARGIAREQIAVLVGRTLVELDGPAAFESLQLRLLAAEARSGPQVPVAPSAGPASTIPPTAAVTSPPSWINGNKRVLWVQVDFADDPGAVATEAEIAVTCSAVNSFYGANSQGRTTMSFTVLPALLRMARDKSYYNASSSTVGELQTNASTLAKAYDAANGGSGMYNPDQYDRWIVLFKRMPAYTFSGQAMLGGPQVRLNGTIAPGTAGHELGHTQSLNHSHYWMPAGASAVGAGAHVEYGDVFDTMGSSGSSANNHFNAAQKAKLGYLEGDAFTSVTQAGTYRIQRHDHVDASAVRGLKIAPENLNYEYWVEHRQFGPTAFNTAQLDRLRNGIILHWGPGHAPSFTTGPGTYLVDATPGSAGTANDAPLRLGESFIDPDAGISIKPLAVGGSAPNEYVDVQVAFGAVDGNHDPVLQAEAPAGPLLARTNLVFRATASDPDGDLVYLRWDFGDGSVQPNLGNITQRFVKGGDYALRVSAHDGKGGMTSKAIPLRIVDPLATWTKRGSGLTTSSVYDVVFAADRFVAVGLSGTILTSRDGIDWSRNADFSSGTSLTGLAHNGSRFVASGYRNNAPSDRGAVAYSDDGTTWTAVSLPTGTAQLWGIDYGAGRFVAVGDAGTIYSSSEGVNWSAASSGITTTLRAVTFADGLFVIVGDNGRFFTSRDGVTWTNQSAPTTAGFWGVERYNGVWYAISASAVYSSSDGTRWTRVTAGSAPNVGTYKAAAVGGVYLVGTINGSIEFTENFQSWATLQLETAASATIRGAAQGKGVIVVVGSLGDIFTAATPPPTAPPIAAPSLRLEADALRLSVGRKNVISGGGSGFTALELYANGSKVSDLAATAGALAWTPAAIGNYSLVVRGVDASGVSVVSSPISAVVGMANWNWRNPSPVGTDLTGAVRVDDKWWIVGGCGTLLTLDANGALTRMDFPTTQNLSSISYGNGRFVVTAPYRDSASHEDVGAIWTSTDGYAWTALLTTVWDAITLNCSAFAAGKWVAGSSGGVILTSIDGLTWTRQLTGTSSSITAIAQGNGMWVATLANGRIITSTDAVSWTSQATGVTTSLNGVAGNGSGFVAAGNGGVILTSTDGASWTRRDPGVSTTLSDVGVIDGSFVVVGDSGVVLQSVDGSAWAAMSLGGRLSNLLFVSGGVDHVLLGRAGEIYRRTSSSNWTRINAGTGDARLGVIHAGGRYVAVGQNSDPLTRASLPPVQTSTDGVNWTRAAANSAFTMLNAVTYGQQTYVAVGSSGRIFTSPDAVNWTQRTSPITTTLQGAAASPAAFVAVGSSGGIASSADGVNWTSRTSGVTGTLRSAAFGNGRFVAIGDNGMVVTSPDGESWSTVASGVTVSLIMVRWFDNFGFIATGNSGTMITSSDGLSWRAVETGVTEYISAITETPYGLAAAGGTGALFLSLDGATWSVATLGVDREVRDLAWGPPGLVAVGDNGATLIYERAASTPAPRILAQSIAQATTVGSSASFSIQAANATGAVYQWFKDGTPIAGANTPAYSMPVTAAASAGSYTVSVTTPTGTVTSSPARLTFAAPANPARLTNLSILTELTSAEDTFTFGVVMGGAGTAGPKALVVRAAGPSLGALGVGGVLEDPKLEFFTGITKVAENDNWGGAETTQVAMAQVGAFPYSSLDSRDAAMSLPTLALGANSARISGRGRGTVIAELYDATPSTAFIATTPRLINVSVLKHIGSGVTAGFTVGGVGTRSVLIRAIGPTLGAAPFNVAGTVANPRLALFNGQTQMGSNDDWGGTAALSAAFAKVGAFALGPSSKDAALLAQLAPGGYTVQVSSADGATGVALIEVYEVPD